MSNKYGWLFESAHLLGLVPLLWLVLRRERNTWWWWIAAGYGVSWVADTLSHWILRDLIYNVYPLSQAGLILAMVVPEKSPRWTVDLTVLGCASILLFGIPFLWPLHVAAWGSLAVVGWRCTGWLRAALLMSFGVGLVAWSATQLQPGWAAWIAFQSTRLVGTALLCAAMTAPFLSCVPRTPSPWFSSARSGSS